MNDTMTEETTAPPKRVRPPRNRTKDPAPPEWQPAGSDSGSPVVSLPVNRPCMISAPPLHIEDPKALEWMDWIFTYLPNEMARNFYGGRNYTPRS